jgi:hypothetical protein
MSETTLQQFDRFIATFQPQQTDDLKPGVAEMIGVRCEWEVAWFIEEEDGGPYVGQWACAAYRPEVSTPFAWAPSCDLTDIAMVGENP